MLLWSRSANRRMALKSWLNWARPSGRVVGPAGFSPDGAWPAWSWRNSQYSRIAEATVPVSQWIETLVRM